MKDPNTLFDILMHHLSDKQFSELLLEGGIPDDRPEVLRERRGWGSKSRDDAFRWIRRNRQLLTALLLRRMNMSNSILYGLVQDGDFVSGEFVQEKACTICFSQYETPEKRQRARATITDAAVAISALTELFTEFALAVQFTEVPIEQPRVDIKGGSVNVVMSGGLFSVGLGLIVATSAGIVTAPIV